MDQNGGIFGTGKMLLLSTSVIIFNINDLQYKYRLRKKIIDI